MQQITARQTEDRPRPFLRVVGKSSPTHILTVRDFEPRDLLSIDVQDHQFSAVDTATQEQARQLMQGGLCFSVTTPDGKLVACLGLLHQWDGRALAWALLSKDAGRKMLPLTRAVRIWLARRCTYRRLEAYVDPTFPQGRRWAHLLGFDLETQKPMAGFYPNGNAAYLYARVCHV